MQIRRWLVVGLALSLLLGAAVWQTRQAASSGPGERALARPPFLAASAAAAETSFIGEKLDDEAGISAYVQTAIPIDLSLMRGQFETIEMETADYIIGSVAVPGYYEHFDPHVYIHKDGWILAYYLQEDPAAKIIDLKALTIDGDKLRTVVGNLAAIAGTSADNIAYYDFRYPNATHILLVAENDSYGTDFSIQLPTAYSYNELSFAVDNCSSIDLDGQRVGADYDQDDQAYGTLTPAQLTPGTTHWIRYYCGITFSDLLVLVITHRVP